MRSTFAIALAAVANAQFVFIDSTTNECWFNEGANYIGKCTNLFYWHCDEYEILPQDSCNVSTFSDSMLEWSWDEVTASVMTYGVENGWRQANKQNSGETTQFESFLKKSTYFAAKQF